MFFGRFIASCLSKNVVSFHNGHWNIDMKLILFIKSRFNDKKEKKLFSLLNMSVTCFTVLYLPFYPFYISLKVFFYSHMKYSRRFTFGGVLPKYFWNRVLLPLPNYDQILHSCSIMDSAFDGFLSKYFRNTSSISSNILLVVLFRLRSTPHMRVPQLLRILTSRLKF